MKSVSITYIGKDYDYLAPLACGDVRAEGIDLTVDRVPETMAGGAAQSQFLATPSIQAGEFSFSLYLIGLSGGDNGLVGIPFFPYRGFRQRCLYVRRGSGISSAGDLDGKRVGLNSWKATGNTWTRAALREAGARLDRIAWLIGPMDDSGRDGAHGKRESDWPVNVQLVPPAQTLQAMLLAGELDAMMSPAPPQGYHEPNSPIARMFPDYRRVEREYYMRTGIYPAHHIVVLRRTTFEQAPWVARRLYSVLEKTKRLWQERRKGLAETTPWMEDEFEQTERTFGADWNPCGVEPNRRLIETLCNEEFDQGLLGRRLHPAEVFAEFGRSPEAPGRE